MNKSTFSAIFFLLALPAFGGEITLTTPPYIYNDSTLGNILNHGDVSVCVNVPSGVTSLIGFNFDTDANYTANHSLAYSTGLSSGTVTGPTGGVGADPCQPIQGLVGGTVYRVCPILSSGGNTTICTSSGTDPNRFATFTTPATPAVDPVPATRAVITFNTAYPAGVPAIGAAGDFAVASNCSNLQSQYAAARAAADGDSLPRAVTIPYTAACSGTPALTITSASTTAWVVIRTDQEASLTKPGVQISNAVYGSLMPTITVTAANNTAITFATSSYVRFVGIRVLFNNGTGGAHAGNPTYTNVYLIKIGSAADHIILDRCVFDGLGYPARLQAAFEIECDTTPCATNNIAWIESDFDNVYSWFGWTGPMTVTGNGTHTLASTATVYVGRGDQVCTVAPWSVLTNDTTSASWVDYLDSSCIHKIGYSAGVAPTCTGVTCVSGTSVAATDFVMNSGFYPGVGGIPMITTSGLWNQVSGQWFWQWGSGGTGNGVITPTGGEANAFAVDAEEAGGTPFLNSNQIIFSNNRVNGSGILWLWEANGVANNMTVNKNTFTKPTNCRMPTAPNASSPPYSCYNRYPWEHKNGYQIEFVGNQVQGDFKSVGTDSSFFSLKPDSVTRAGSYAGDAYIAHNIVTKGVGCFYLSTQKNNGPGWTAAPKPIRRVTYFNNFCESDSYSYTSYWGKNGSGVANWGFIGVSDAGAIDTTISHNTWINGAGPGPAYFFTDAWSHATSFIGNIFPFQQLGGTYYGLQAGAYEGTVGTAPVPNMGFGTQLHAQSAIDAGVVALGTSIGTSWSWDTLYIGGCTDSTPANCSPSTTGGNIMSVPVASYPASTRWPTGASLNAKYATVGFASPTLTNWRLIYSSPYISGGASHSSDGLTYGWNQDLAEDAAGIIKNVRPLGLAATSVSVAFHAPAVSVACYVATNTTGVPPWTVTSADTSASQERSISVSGLTTKTPYQGQVWCEGSAPTATFGFETR